MRLENVFNGGIMVENIHNVKNVSQKVHNVKIVVENMHNVAKISWWKAPLFFVLGLYL